jgi:5-methylthioadenosine/S-adenosylhomocysteine deaminase
VTFDDDASYYKDRAYQDTLTLMQWIKDHEPENNGRIKADVSVHSEYANREKALLEAFAFAIDEGMIIQAHISETKAEHEECKARHGMTPVAYFEKLGAFRSPLIAAHCVWLEDADVDIMIRNGAYMSHNPSSNLKLGSGIAPVKKFREKGMNITIGTDGASSNNNLNMLEEVKLFATLFKAVTGDPTAITPRQALCAATRAGALSQGREDCGLVKEGFRADLTVLDLRDKAYLRPCHDMLNNVVFSALGSDVCLTMADGRVLYRDGVYTTMDPAALAARADESIRKILSQL